MTRAEHYDVAVVGAGPAGSLAARVIAESGAKVVLLERSPTVGPPVKCGEFVLRNSIAQLTTVKPSWIARTLTRGFLHFPDETAIEVSLERGAEALVLERTIFDRELAEQAAVAGADIITRAEVTGLIINQQRVEGLHYQRFGSRHTIQAHLVIAADGVESRVGRWAGIKTQIPVADFGSAYQMTLSGLDFDCDYGHIFFSQKLAPGGFFWIFPKRSKTANVGLAVASVTLRDSNVYENLRIFIKSRLGRCSVVSELSGAVPGSPPVPTPWAHGLILAGDAARHCNPLTGGGIFAAMYSGYQAGKTSVEALQKGDFSPNCLQRFHQHIEQQILKPHRQAYKLARITRKFDDRTLNKIGQTISPLPVEQRTFRKILMKGLSTQPKLVLNLVRGYFFS